MSSHQFPAPNTEHIILNAWKKPVNQDSEHKRNPKKRNKTKRPKGEKSQEEIQKLTETVIILDHCVHIIKYDITILPRG